MRKAELMKKPLRLPQTSNQPHRQQQYIPQRQEQQQIQYMRCRHCGLTYPQRQILIYRINTKYSVEMIGEVFLYQSDFIQAQQQRQYQQQQAPRHPHYQSHQHQQRDPFENFHKNFEWAQQMQQNDSDEMSQEEVDSDDNYHTNISYQQNGTQMPPDVQVQFQQIFGPDGVFTQSMSKMSQMSQIMSNFNNNFSVNININQPNIHIQMPNFQFRYFFYKVNISSSHNIYNEDDQEDLDEDEDEEFEQEEDEPEEQEVEGLSENEIRRMPTSYFIEKKNENNKNCVVCMTDFKSGEKIRTIKCLHKFHQECIDNWLRIKGICPICRHIINQ